MKRLTGILAMSLLMSAPVWAEGISDAKSQLKDSEIADIVVTANQVDIDAGKYAQKHASSAQVKQLAKHMINDHEASNKQTKSLAKKLGIKPESNDLASSLKSDGKDSMSKLKELKGAEFDKAYVDGEVAMHQKVLDTIDKQLLPNAQDPQLKALIEKTRPVIASHLEHAKTIQSKLGTS